MGWFNWFKKKEEIDAFVLYPPTEKDREDARRRLYFFCRSDEYQNVSYEDYLLSIQNKKGAGE